MIASIWGGVRATPFKVIDLPRRSSPDPHRKEAVARAEPRINAKAQGRRKGAKKQEWIRTLSPFCALASALRLCVESGSPDLQSDERQAACFPRESRPALSIQFCDLERGSSWRAPLSRSQNGAVKFAVILRGLAGSARRSGINAKAQGNAKAQKGERELFVLAFLRLCGSASLR